MSQLDYSYIADLVVACWNDDSKAFAELYALTQDRVYNYCYHYLHDSYLAQDAVQDIYITALQNIRKLKDPSLFVAWLNQISFHTCYDMTKKKKKDNESYDSDVFDFLQDNHFYLNPEEALDTKVNDELLKAAIDSLCFNEKQIIVMHYMQSMKLKDIANAMGLSLSTIKRHLSSAQKNLKKLLTASS